MGELRIGLVRSQDDVVLDPVFTVDTWPPRIHSRVTGSVAVAAGVDGVGRMQIAERDGVTLAFQEEGRGGPPMVFIHPWCGDHSFFAPQVEYFKQDHRTLAVDLRGHGASTLTGPYSIETFASDTAWLCSELGISGAVVVGNSMGANVAVELAVTAPEVVSALVLLDAAPVNPSPTFLPLLQHFVEQLRGPTSEQAQREYCAGFLFLPDDDSTRTRDIVDRLCATDRTVAAEAFDASINWDGEAIAQGLVAPVTILVASDLQPADATGIRAVVPHATIETVPGVGHFLQLEDPDEINRRIEHAMTAQNRQHRPTHEAEPERTAEW